MLFIRERAWPPAARLPVHGKRPFDEWNGVC